jgi:S1-C subfamily serine protease
MKRLITALSLMAATAMTIGVGECQARNYDGLTVGATQTWSSDDFLNESTWYLGLKGTVLPQAGLGIDRVVLNSPADRAGLEAGMVIISCNDILITEEADMLRVMNMSDGILMVIVLLEDGSEAQTVVEMVQVSSVTL